MTVDPAAGAQPQALLRPMDGLALIVGVVVGIGIFKVPALVAARFDDPLLILSLWLAGAVIMLVGALCYAELASAWPDAGGEYHFLARAFGPAVGFLFAWGRLVVVQTGAIALVAFVFGDYAQRLLDLGPYGASIFAASAVIVVAGANITGTRLSARVQRVIAAILVAAVAVAALLGFVITPEPASPAPAVAGMGAATESLAAAMGSAMIFIMLTYGGWNDAAYLSAELHDVKRNMVRVAVGATVVIGFLYLTINAAYLRVLGVGGLGASAAPGADYMEALLGPAGGAVLSGVVVIAALSTLNATIFTGARSVYAMGRDVPLLAVLGRWDGRAQGPVAAHLIQAAMALVLVGFGTVTRQGFATMVDYTAPVFWFFLTLTAAAVFVKRRRGGGGDAFRVPFYPFTPLLFCAVSAYMLYAALAYTGVGALVGVGAVALGLPLWWAARRALGEFVR
jgi:amino acid transporter